MANEWDDLQPQQYAKHYIEDDVPLKDVRKSTLRKAVYIGAGLFALLMVAGATIKFPDEVSLPFVLRGEVPERIYRFPYPVYVEETFTASGAVVKQGAPLVRITSPQIVSLIHDYRQAEDALANYRTNRTRSVSDTRDMVRLQAAQNTHLLQEIRQRQAALQKTWQSNEARLRLEMEDANKKLAQNQALYKSAYISANELETYKLAQTRAADALTTATEAFTREAAALREEAARTGLQNTSLSREEDRYATDARTDFETLNNTFTQARAAIQHSFGDFEIADGNLILKAGSNGVVSFLFEGDREVPASAILLKVTGSTNGLYASAVSPPSLIGKLKRGQTAYLKVATFPAYEWGAAKGHIHTLSLTPDEEGVFNIKISVDDARKLARRLQPGMDGTLAVQLDERTFFQYFFRNLKKSAATIRGDG